MVMVISIRSLTCPNCRSSELIRIGRRLWMRLLKGSKFYKCAACSHIFLYCSPHPLFHIGLFISVSGQFLWILSYFAGDIGIGFPGFGSLEHIGVVLGLITTTVGLAIVTVGIIKTIRSLKA